MDPLKPDPTLLCKLGSIIIHFEEFMSNDGHYLDKDALDALLANDDIQDWLLAMEDMALLPRKRNKDG